MSSPLSKGQGRIPSVVLVIGSERWLRHQAIQRFIALCIRPGFEDLDLIRFSGPPEEPQQIFEQAATAPFGSLRRVVLLQGLAEGSEESLPWLSRYLAHPCSTCCLILCAERLGSIPRRFAPEGTPSVELIWCHPLKGASLRRWIGNQAKAFGKGIEPEAVDLLITRVGSELSSLALAVESLTLYVGQRKQVTSKDVEDLIFSSVRETAFDILESAYEGKPALAIGNLRKALAQGRLTVEQWMGALGWYYRAHPNRWSRRRLKKELEEVLQAEWKLKQGHPTPELLADQLLIRLGDLS